MGEIKKNEPVWVPLKQLLKILQEYDMWSIDTKYLHIYLDTRFINGDWNCTIKDRNNEKYLSLEDLVNARKSFNI